MTPEILAYAAGIVDGEGCISIISKGGGHENILVKIVNTDKRLGDWFIKYFGGTFRLGSCKQQNPKHKPIWIWETSCAKGEQFLELILPYLVIKKPQALIALEFRQQIDYTRSPEKNKKKKQLIKKIHQLNKRGVEVKGIL